MNGSIYRAKSIWLTGLSGAGKTTVAAGLALKLKEQGIAVAVLDGDVVRKGLCSDLQYTPDDRMENIRRIAEISGLLVKQGISTINSFIQPTEEIRRKTQHIVGQEHYLEIFVDAPLEICEARDVKGLYKKARLGLIKDFTGISAPFEIPKNAHLIISTDSLTIDDCVKAAYAMVIKNMKGKVSE